MGRMARGLPRVDRCRAPTGSILRPLTTGGEWPSRVIGEASRDRACRASVGRDKRTGKYVVRWRSDGRHRSKSFTYQRDAERWDREQKRQSSGRDTSSQRLSGQNSVTHSWSSRRVSAIPRRGRRRRSDGREGARDCFRRLPIRGPARADRCEPSARRTKAEAPAQAICWGSCTLLGREDPGGIAGCGAFPRCGVCLDVGIRGSAARRNPSAALVGCTGRFALGRTSRCRTRHQGDQERATSRSSSHWGARR